MSASSIATFKISSINCVPQRLPPEESGVFKTGVGCTMETAIPLIGSGAVAIDEVTFAPFKIPSINWVPQRLPPEQSGVFKTAVGCTTGSGVAMIDEATIGATAAAVVVVVFVVVSGVILILFGSSLDFLVGVTKPSSYSSDSPSVPLFAFLLPFFFVVVVVRFGGEEGNDGAASTIVDTGSVGVIVDVVAKPASIDAEEETS